MFRYAFLAAPSAVADAPKAAAFPAHSAFPACPAHDVLTALEALTLLAALDAPVDVATAAAAFDGARS